MSKICFLCKSTEDNELLFGKFYSKWKIYVHYYCLLLSSNLVQGGSNDTIGIFGFLESDIRKENERTKKCRCYICKNMHANVSCCSKKCLRTFHTVCGIMNGCLSHYTDTYQSWCSSHVPLEPDSSPHSHEEPCSICYDEMGQYNVITSIKAPCCLNGWFHQRCLAQYAQSAGYFFKCPLCKNEDKFLLEMPLRGVFVPERDAAWELEPNAFQEQLQRPTACDAEDCKCPEGRSVDNRQWRQKVCGCCGATSRHLRCIEQTTAGSRVYLCQLCKPIVGDRVPEPESDNDSADSSGDDTDSTSSSTPLAETLLRRPRKNLSRAGSGESGVHCSSGDEMLANIRRSLNARKILSDGSDSERSDASSIQIRRCIRQNTGKRVRRLLSDGSDSEKRSQTPAASSSDGQPEPDVCKRLDDDSDSTGAPSMCSDQSSHATGSDGNVSSSSGLRAAVVRSTRQLSRRLSSLSDTSKRSTSESNTEEPRPKSSIIRRPRIVSSSDDLENPRSEKEAINSQVRNSARQRGNKLSRLSTSSEDSEKRVESKSNVPHAINGPLTSTKNSKATPRPTNSEDPSTSSGSSTKAVKNIKTLQKAKSSSKRRKSNDGSNSTDSKRWDENSNMTETRSPPSSKKDENACVSDTSSEGNGAGRRTRQLARRQSLPDAGKRSTSESSMESIRPKRIRAARNSSSFEDAGKRTENGENNSSDRGDTVPLNKRRRLARERCNKPNQSATAVCRKPSSISPPSTPSSLSSESSQPSATAGTATPNRQQQSMLQFITFSSRKLATTSDSSDQSAEETVSPSRWARFGSSNNINSKNSSISSKSAKSTTAKRRRTHSPKKSNKQPCSGQQTETAGATSSKGTTPPQRTQKGIMHKAPTRERDEKKIIDQYNFYHHH
uniref:PHD-type domain-containing protein n=1 Tax=Anopheles minimus TaxID=112268 RepID=A0A182VRR1_9DIPT